MSSALFLVSTIARPQNCAPAQGYGFGFGFGFGFGVGFGVGVGFGFGFGFGLEAASCAPVQLTTLPAILPGLIERR